MILVQNERGKRALLDCSSSSLKYFHASYGLDFPLTPSRYSPLKFEIVTNVFITILFSHPTFTCSIINSFVVYAPF